MSAMLSRPSRQCTMENGKEALDKTGRAGDTSVSGFILVYNITIAWVTESVESEEPITSDLNSGCSLLFH